MYEKKHNRLLPIILYLLFTLLDILLWLPFPRIIHFVGMSSLFHLLLFALGNARSAITVLSLILIPVLMVLSIICYILAHKHQFFAPFLVIAGLDLFLSGLVIAYKIAIHNHLDLDVALLGFATRLLYYVWMTRRIVRRKLD